MTLRPSLGSRSLRTSPASSNPVEHPGDRPGRKSGEIGELTSSRGAGTLQDIHNLQIRDGQSEPGRRRSEKGRGKSSKLPQLPRSSSGTFVDFS